MKWLFLVASFFFPLSAGVLLKKQLHSHTYTPTCNLRLVGPFPPSVACLIYPSPSSSISWCSNCSHNDQQHFRPASVFISHVFCCLWGHLWFSGTKYLDSSYTFLVPVLESVTIPVYKLKSGCLVYLLLLRVLIFPGLLIMNSYPNLLIILFWVVFMRYNLPMIKCTHFKYRVNCILANTPL